MDLLNPQELRDKFLWTFADSSLTEPCVSHVEAFRNRYNTRLGCYFRRLADWLGGLIRLLSKIHTNKPSTSSLHMTHGIRRVQDLPSQGWHLRRWRYLARASVYCASGGVLRRHHGRTVCRASLRAETRKQGLTIDSKRASVRSTRDLVAQTLLGDGVCRDDACCGRGRKRAL